MATILPAPTDSMVSLIEALPSVTASELKNKFGEVSSRAMKGAIAIKRHRRSEFVLIPASEYAELQQARSAPLEALSGQFDAMVARMNTPTSKRGVAKLFKATSKQLGKSAVKAAQVHGS